MDVINIQEQLRAAIRPQSCIDKLIGIDAIVADEWRSLGKNQIEALRLRADINLRLLAKELADRKATEVTGEGQAPVQFVFSVSRNAEESIKQAA